MTNKTPPRDEYDPIDLDDLVGREFICKEKYDTLQAELDELHQKMLSAQPYYYNEWQKLQSRLEKCEVLLTKAGTVIGDVPWSGPCKELDVLHSIDDYFAEVEK